MSDDSVNDNAFLLGPSHLKEKWFRVVRSDNVDRSVLPNFNGRPNWNRRPSHLPARQQPEKPAD